MASRAWKWARDFTRSEAASYDLGLDTEKQMRQACLQRVPLMAFVARAERGSPPQMAARCTQCNREHCAATNSYRTADARLEQMQIRDAHDSPPYLRWMALTRLTDQSTDQQRERCVCTVVPCGSPPSWPCALEWESDPGEESDVPMGRGMGGVCRRRRRPRVPFILDVLAFIPVQITNTMPHMRLAHGHIWMHVCWAHGRPNSTV